MHSPQRDTVIITGTSGIGKSTAVQILKTADKDVHHLNDFEYLRDTLPAFPYG